MAASPKPEPSAGGSPEDELRQAVFPPESLIAPTAERPVATGRPPPPPSDPNAGLRKFRAKRNNEHVKAVYTLTNTLGAAIIGAAYILPEIQGLQAPQALDRPTWVGVGLAVIAFGHAVIRWGTQRED